MQDSNKSQKLPEFSANITSYREKREKFLFIRVRDKAVYL
jgi:hypothetical protein